MKEPFQHTLRDQSEAWRLPGWMEPYRQMIESDLGGNTIENLLNDKTTNGFNNVIRAGLICVGESKVGLLHQLRRAGKLADQPPLREQSVSSDLIKLDDDELVELIMELREKRDWHLKEMRDAHPDVRPVLNRALRKIAFVIQCVADKTGEKDVWRTQE